MTRNESPKMRTVESHFAVGVALIAAVMVLAGCSGGGFGAPKKEEPPTDPNAYPATYRTQIATFLRQSLTNRNDFRGASISAPTLKPIGNNQRYTVCVKFNPNSQIKTKVAIYFAGMISQFIDATPEQCDSAAYQPFTELQAALPPT